MLVSVERSSLHTSLRILHRTLLHRFLHFLVRYWMVFGEMLEQTRKASERFPSLLSQEKVSLLVKTGRRPDRLPAVPNGPALLAE